MAEHARLTRSAARLEPSSTSPSVDMDSETPTRTEESADADSDADWTWGWEKQHKAIDEYVRAIFPRNPISVLSIYGQPVSGLETRMAHYIIDRLDEAYRKPVTVYISDTGYQSRAVEYYLRNSIKDMRLHRGILNWQHNTPVVHSKGLVFTHYKDMFDSRHWIKWSDQENLAFIIDAKSIPTVDSELFWPWFTQSLSSNKKQNIGIILLYTSLDPLNKVQNRMPLQIPTSRTLSIRVPPQNPVIRRLVIPNIEIPSDEAAQLLESVINNDKKVALFGELSPPCFTNKDHPYQALRPPAKSIFSEGDLKLGQAPYLRINDILTPPSLPNLGAVFSPKTRWGLFWDDHLRQLVMCTEDRSPDELITDLSWVWRAVEDSEQPNQNMPIFISDWDPYEGMENESRHVSLGGPAWNKDHMLTALSLIRYGGECIPRQQRLCQARFDHIYEVACARLVEVHCVDIHLKITSRGDMILALLQKGMKWPSAWILATVKLHPEIDELVRHILILLAALANLGSDMLDLVSLAKQSYVGALWVGLGTMLSLLKKGTFRSIIRVTDNLILDEEYGKAKVNMDIAMEVKQHIESFSQNCGLKPLTQMDDETMSRMCLPVIPVGLEPRYHDILHREIAVAYMHQMVIVTPDAGFDENGNPQVFHALSPQRFHTTDDELLDLKKHYKPGGEFCAIYSELERNSHGNYIVHGLTRVPGDTAEALGISMTMPTEVRATHRVDLVAEPSVSSGADEDDAEDSPLSELSSSSSMDGDTPMSDRDRPADVQATTTHRAELVTGDALPSDHDDVDDDDDYNDVIIRQRRRRRR